MIIISRTPYRISFFGGGTDYPAWYRKEGGAVLSATLDKYCYISARFLPPFFNIRHRIVWSHIETVNTISEILHPAVREGLRFLGFDDSAGLEIHHQGDLPARSGIGSSSSFSGLIKALMALRGQMIGKHDLALKAIELEQNILKENVGSQDQVAAAYGGLNLMHFLQNGTIQVEPLTLGQDRIRELESNLLMLYTGSSRLANEIAASVIANLHQRSAELTKLRHMADQACSLLVGNGSLDAFGEMLHEAWMLKRGMADGVTNATVDEIYRIAREHGALGGKLCGAGSKGFMFFYIPREKQPAVMKALNHYLWVPVGFDWEGCSTIYYENPVQQR